MSSSRPILIALTLAASLVLAGCGQKGPLYLPDAEAAAERSATDTGAPNDDES